MSIFRRLRQIIPTGGTGKPVRLVTDSTADLAPETVRELGITIVPLQVVFGEETFRDGVDLTGEEFFRRLQEAEETPKTSQPSVGDFQQTYERLAEETNRVLSIHLSSGFSGTVEAARQAAQELGERCQIEVIDSQTVSMGMGFAVIAAARAAQAGEDLESCAGAARSVLKRQRMAIAFDTLEYLRRGGRIGRAQAFLGSILRLKPILTIRDGEAYPLSRVRTYKRALEEVLRLTCSEGPVVEAAVMHSTSPEDAGRVADELARLCPEARIQIGRIGPVIGVHGGPGLLGIAAVHAEDGPGEEPEGGAAKTTS